MFQIVKVFVCLLFNTIQLGGHTQRKRFNQQTVHTCLPVVHLGFLQSLIH